MIDCNFKDEIMTTLPIKYLMVGVFLAVFTSNSQAARDCSAEKKSHQSIQNKLRKGGKPSAMSRLQERERKAWLTWWQCQKGKTKKKAKKKAKKTQKLSGKTQAQMNQNQRKIIKAKSPTYAENKPLVIKGAFSGAKQQAWLNAYDKPKKCIRPKVMSVFAYCVEHAKKAQEIFDQQYNQKH